MLIILIMFKVGVIKEEMNLSKQQKYIQNN